MMILYFFVLFRPLLRIAMNLICWWAILTTIWDRLVGWPHARRAAAEANRQAEARLAVAAELEQSARDLVAKATVLLVAARQRATAHNADAATAAPSTQPRRQHSNSQGVTVHIEFSFNSLGRSARNNPFRLNISERLKP